MIKCRLGRYAGRFLLCALVLCFFISSAAAQSAASLSPMLSDWLARINAGEAADVSITANLHTLVPYGDDTVSAMDRLLSQCGLKIAYQQKGLQETTGTQLMIGGMPAISFLEQTGNAYLAKTSLLPDMTLSGKTDSPMELLLGGGTEIPFWTGSVPDPVALTQEIAGALAGLSSFAAEKSGSFSLSSAGKAQKAIVYTVPQESAVLLGQSLTMFTDALHWTGASSLFKSLTLTGNAVVTLYQAADDTIMGLGIKAVMGFSNVAPRRVTFLWGFSAGESQSLHVLSLKAPSVKGSDFLTVAGQWKLSGETAKNSLAFNLDIKGRLDGKNSRTKWSGQLDCLMAEDNQRLEGEIKKAYTDEKGIDYTLALKPGLLVYRLEGNDSLKGSIRIQYSKEKNVLTDATLSILAQKTADVAFGDEQNITLLESLDESAWKSLQDKAQAAAVQAVWRAVMALPEETLAFISKNISQKDWERIYQSAYQVGD